MSAAFFCALPHEGIITIQGIDSKKFLQSQLTCNLDYLSITQTSLGARCTPKGRMISSFRVIEQAANHYLLCLDQRLIEKQITDLKKYAIFSKVTLTEESTDWVRFGLSSTDDKLQFLNIDIPTENNQLSRQAGQLLIKISHNRFELWIPKAQAQEIEQLLNAHLAVQPLNVWLLGQIEAGIGQVFLETSETFIPQMINIQSLGGVSFKKGCYTGQEIVARMQYLGKLKRHLYRFTLNSPQLPAIATPLFSTTHSTAVGEVVLAATTTTNTIEILAVVQDDAVEAKLWLQDHEEQPLKLLPLPYRVNPDEEIKR